MTDIEIQNMTELKNIKEVAKELGLKEGEYETYGKYRAKIVIPYSSSKGKLILVTAINPTKAGEGKTTVSIGLADALRNIGKKTCLALREPSLGPVFGAKGGATGGGYSQVAPMIDINLHFNGDFHAITSANNLLCSMIDNHVFQGNELEIDVNKVLFNRCLDLNDRALRDVTITIDSKKNIVRKEKFNITPASEVMAILCLAENLADLKERLGNIIVALNIHGEPVYARDLSAQDAMAILLKDAIKPNLVQTLSGTPAIIHGGPFANIAHGCNSIIATKTALSLADYVVTEAGFGADLGAEKFLDMKCRISHLRPDAVVMVATVRALKLHGGVEEDKLEIENIDALNIGLENLKKHIENIKNVYHLPVIVAINQFSTDTQAEIEAIQREIEGCCNVEAIPVDVWARGGSGTAKELASKVCEICEEKSEFEFCYDLNDSIPDKIKAIATKIYGASDVIFNEKAVKDMEDIIRLNQAGLPVIIAKTQYSLSDNAKRLGRPKDFVITVKELQLRGGAGFIVAICGTTLLMPGLPKTPASVRMKIDKEGNITGLS